MWTTAHVDHNSVYNFWKCVLNVMQLYKLKQWYATFFFPPADLRAKFVMANYREKIRIGIIHFERVSRSYFQNSTVAYVRMFGNSHGGRVWKT